MIEVEVSSEARAFAMSATVMPVVYNVPCYIGRFVLLLTSFCVGLSSVG